MAVLTVACYWLSSHCVPAQKFVSMSGKLNHDRSPLVLDSDKSVLSPLLIIIYLNWIDSHSRVDEGSQLGAAASTVYFLQTFWHC